MAKEYGLITKKPSSSSSGLKRHSVFGDDSDSDDDGSKPKINLSLGKVKEQQIKRAQQNALAEDPTIYQYDEIFEEVQSQRNALKESKKKEDKSSKYIQQLLKSADKRKKDYERHIERQVQKEREADADMFKDKESFVTSAYRQKLEEMKIAEEEEKRQDYLEAIGDVTKQQDLGGFYRHLYEQKLGPVKPTKTKNENESNNHEKDENRKSLELSTIPKGNTQKKERIYRKRKIAENEEDEEEKTKTEHLPCNLDADSDFSIDSDSDDNDDEKENENNQTVADECNEEKMKIKVEKSDVVENGSNKKIDKKTVENETKMENGATITEVKLEVVKKPKIDKWKKRTVGEVFEAALIRYYERKSLRQSN